MFLSFISNYKKYFVLSIAFIVGFYNKSAAYELKITDRAEKIEKQENNDDFPFSDKEGYISGGKSFDCVIKDELGKEFSISDFKGKVVIVAFYTTWCHNCPEVLQSLDNLSDNLEKSGINDVKIVALNVGNDSINTTKVHYKAHDIQLLEIYQSVLPHVIKGVKGVPACFVFNNENKAIWGYIGGDVSYNSSKFITFIEKLSKKQVKS